MSETRRQIRAALAGNKKLLLSALQADCVDDALLVKGTIGRMVRTGELLKHAGESAHKSLYSLSPGFVEGLPAVKSRKSAKKTGKKAGAPRKPRKAKQPRKTKTASSSAPPAPERAFLPAITADMEIVLIGAGPAPILFSKQESCRIADLVFANFTPGQ